MNSPVTKYYVKHYEKNRDKILDYKKLYYAEKVKYRKQFQNIKLKGVSKIDTNRIIKKSIDELACFISVDGLIMNPEEFYNAYDIKDFSIIEIEYEYFDNYELTMKIPIYSLTLKN